LFCRPTTGVLPQISQCFAINSPSSRISKYIGRLRDDQTRRIGRSARGLGGLAFAGAYEAFQHVEQRPPVCRLEFVDVARCLLDSSDHDGGVPPERSAAAFARFYEDLSESRREPLRAL